ncbi:LysR family transcriptional regulator [Dyella sp. 2HG41-7]|uniref:LysR family transcriptional regulator n=1 Tax=Dyella sp. 2HG41-7 TaxID=2883239 RepID=UPI001F2AB6AD|nr:LysR family transcriptional regulator [Dyella sp. 2HG41-7]
MNVEMRYLHTFRVVCDAGSLRAASGILHRTEQAVSYQLRKLEEALGMPVFHRGIGRLTPNAAGERLLAFCREMGRDWEKLHEELNQAASLRMPLRISAVSGFGRYQLLPLFRDGPLADIPIRMRYPTADDVMRHVESGTSDLGFIHRLDTHARLSLIPIGAEEIVLIASARLSQPALSLEIKSLLHAQYVTYDESDYVFATWFSQVVGTNVAPPHVIAHFEELEEVLDWVAAGRGISIVPAACVTDHEAQGDIVVLRKPEALCRNTIYAVVDPAVRHAAIEQTLQAVREHAAF